MNSAEATTSPAIEEIWRAGFLEALARAPRAAVDERTTSLSPPPATETVGGWPSRATDVQMLRQWSIPGITQGTGAGARRERDIAAVRVIAAAQPEEIVAALSLGGCRAAADRIGDLHEMSTDDDARDEPPMVLTSLRELALFLLSQRRLVEPRIGLSPDGLLQAEWASPDRGVVAMKFLPDGIIRFAAVSAAGGAGPRLRVHGELPKDRALDAVRAFIPSLDGSDARRVAA